MIGGEEQIWIKNREECERECKKSRRKKKKPVAEVGEEKKVKNIEWVRRGG